MKTTLVVIVALAVAGGSVYLWKSNQGKELTVSGISMQPTLDPGDKVRLIAEPGRPYKRADLVAINFQTRERLMVKRIIALEGEEVTRINGVVHINGAPLIMPGWTEGRRVEDRQWKLLGIQLANYDNRVPKDNVIVMGDNTENSYDSGDFGMLSLSQVTGLVKQ